MDTVISTLACCLLALSFAVAQTGITDLTVTTPPPTSGSNLRPVTTTSNSTSTVEPTTVPSTEGTTEFSSTTPRPVTSSSSSTVHTTEITSDPLTPSTVVTISTQTHTTPSTQSPTITTVTTEVNPTTVTDTSGTITPDRTTDIVSHTIPTTTSNKRGLNISEKSMTVVFSVILGVFIVAVVVFAFHKCKHKIQYFHQPLNSEDNTDAFVDDGDTLVISGGLYDGHPIYDNVPPPPSDRSQFHLDFLR